MFVSCQTNQNLWRLELQRTAAYLRATSVCELSDLPESVETRSPAYSSIRESYQCLCIPELSDLPESVETPQRTAAYVRATSVSCIPELSDLPESVETGSPAYSSIHESYQCLCIPDLSDPPESETRNLAC